MNAVPDDGRRRRRLAAIARAEAERGPAGDEHRAGREIEKYLGIFRETLNRRAGTREYSDLSRGFDWCAAFCAWCCLEAGFDLALEPSPRVNGSLAAVRTWFEWASLPGSGLLVARAAGAEVGDVVLFDRLLEDTPLDHLGIVVAVEPGVVVTAEGNVGNRAGIFRRAVDERVRGFVRLADVRP